MATPIPRVLVGHEEWTLPADWREVSPKCVRAIQVVGDTAQMANVPFDEKRLLDVVWAIRLIADTPPQLRPLEMGQLAQMGLDSLREHQKASRPSFKAGRVLLGLATGGASELAGVVARPLVRRVSEYVEERIVGEDGATDTVLQTVWEKCLDAVLDNQWKVHARLEQGSDLANELVYLVSWRSLSREWNASVPLAEESEFVRAVQAFANEYDAIRRSPAAMVNVWISSPFDSPITEIQKMQKKLEKGHLPPEISSALMWYRDREESILRHVRELSLRLGWASMELREAAANPSGSIATDGTW